MIAGISEDFLLNIATIAIALIGFSGVVTALEHGDAGDWTAAELLQFRTLVEPSIFVFFGAFVPFFLGFAGVTGEMVWRLSNVVMLAFHLLGISLFWMRGVRGGVTFSQKLITALCVPIFLMMLTSAIGIMPLHELAFALGLILGVGVSVHNFYLLLFQE